MIEGAVLRSRFGSRVRILLARTGRTSADLAALSKLRVGRVEKILDGKYARLTVMDMDIIAGALATPLYSLLVPQETSVADTVLGNDDDSA